MAGAASAASAAVLVAFPEAAPLITAMRLAGAVACSASGQAALRAAVRAGCPKSGKFLTFENFFARQVAGVLSGGMVPLACLAGGLPALNAAISAVCAEDVQKAVRDVDDANRRGIETRRRVHEADEDDDPPQRTSKRPTPTPTPTITASMLLAARPFTAPLEEQGYPAAKIRAAAEYIARELPALPVEEQSRKALTWLRWGGRPPGFTGLAFGCIFR